MKRLTVQRVFGLIMAAWLMQGIAWAQSAADTALIEMQQAHRRGDAQQLAGLLPRVQGHVLEPLARYWDIRARLDTASAVQVREALSRLAGTYWEDRLRNDWLLVLGRQRDWATFAEELPRFRMQDDRQVQCYALMLDAVAQRGSADALARLTVHRWLAQRDADEGCATAAKALLDSGHLEARWVWQRARLAMEAGRIPAVTQAVAMLDRDAVPMVQAIATNPTRYLDQKITALRPRTKELVTLAIIKMADTSPDAAAQELERTRWRAQLTQEERSWLWGVIGKRAAQRLQDNALEHFARGQNRYMHADHLAWKARAGLRAGAWGAVWDAIAAMPEDQQRQPVWVYWRARAQQALGRPDPVAAAAQANRLYESIATPEEFYGQLALEALGRPISPPVPPAAPTDGERQAALQNPGLERALAAIALGLRSEGVREWNYTIALHTPGGMNDRELLAAAALACERQIWDRCINSSDRSRGVQNFNQRYPMPYRDAVVQRAHAIGLDPAYVYGLIRQESRFITDARSHVGASGLMQVMPATARWTARQIGMTDFQPHRITERDTNITIGTAYLKLALDDFDGSLPLAAAAYNAGPNRPRAWRKGPVLPAEIWAENIPFEETRDYVKKVLANTTVYAAIITGQAQSLRHRLGTVGPRSDDTPVNTDLP